MLTFSENKISYTMKLKKGKKIIAHLQHVLVFTIEKFILQMSDLFKYLKIVNTFIFFCFIFGHYNHVSEPNSNVTNSFYAKI